MMWKQLSFFFFFFFGEFSSHFETKYFYKKIWKFFPFCSSVKNQPPQKKKKK
jgi:hypothetical protein